VPQAAEKSWPQWNSPASPVIGLRRRPNEEDGVRTSRGAMRKPAAGRFSAVEATPGDLAVPVLVVLTVEFDTVRPAGAFAGAAMPDPLIG
jgi:hypothetical protein